MYKPRSCQCSIQQLLNDQDNNNILKITQAEKKYAENNTFIVYIIQTKVSN